MPDPNINTVLKSLQEYYLKGEYTQGIDLLLKHKHEFEPALFHYNLGTFYVKRDDLPVGRFHFEKALKLGFADFAVKKNLNSTKSKLGLVKLEKSYSLGDRLLFKLTDYPADLYYGLSLIIFLCIGLLAFTKLLKSKLWIGVGLLLGLMPSIVQTSMLRQMNFAVAFQQTEIREGPSSIFPLSGQLPAGSKVIIRKLSDGWGLVASPLRFSGWVKTDNLGQY